MNKTKQHKFISFLKERLTKKLPGIEAHKAMSPKVGEDFHRTFTPSPDAKESAVLALLFGEEPDFKALFTVRTNNISHSGQISFPGGSLEEGETAEDAALRETCEEVGIPSENIELIGRLTKLYVPPSNSLITPVLGYAEKIPKLKVNPAEVAEAFSIKIDDFHTDRNIESEIWDFDGVKVETPFWNVHEEVPLWGATAMMLREIMDLYKEYLSKNENRIL